MQGFVHPEATLLFRLALKVTRYPAQVNGQCQLLTAKEYAVIFPRQRLLYTEEVKQHKSLKNRIKHRISPRFRYLEDIKKSRAFIKARKLPQELMSELPNGSMTGTQDLLITFFIKQFIYYGSRALLVHFTDDPTENSYSYGEEILSQFAAKPDDYKLLLTKQLTGQKHCTFYKENTKPTQLPKTHKVLGLSSGATPSTTATLATDQPAPLQQEMVNPASTTKRKLKTSSDIKEEKENVCRSAQLKSKISYIKANDSESQQSDLKATLKKAWKKEEGDPKAIKGTPKKKSK